MSLNYTFAIFPSLILFFGKDSLSPAYTKRQGGDKALFHRKKDHLSTLFEITAQGRFTSSPLLFIQSFNLYQCKSHVYSSYTLGYNPILDYFVAQIVLSLATGNFLKLASLSR